MCLISAFPPGIEPDLQHLRNGAEVWNDGYGYAVVGEFMIHTAKLMDAEKAIEQFARTRELLPDGWAVFHSRGSTGTAAKLAHCHPFKAGTDERTLIFHNGSLPFTDWVKEQPLSDTEVFARHLFPLAFSNLDDKEQFQAMEDWLTPYNKAAILTVNPRYAENAYIVNRDQWIVAPDGSLHSNQDFLGYGTGWDEKVDWETGDVHRWRIPVAGQCRRCHQMGCSGEGCLSQPNLMPGQRNETLRRALVRVAGEQ